MGKNVLAKSKEDRKAEIRAELKPQQQKCYDLAQTGRNLFITGSGGVGKTKLIESLFDSFANCEKPAKKCLLTASTGKAAEGMAGKFGGGITVCKAFGFGADLGINKRRTGFVCQKALVAKADVLFVDEISMVPISQFSALVEAVWAGNKIREAEGKKPTQLIVCGDFFQCKPVLTQEDRMVLEDFYMRKYGIDLAGKGCYAFQSPHWKKCNFETVNLTECIRISDQREKDRMEAIRRGKATWAICNEIMDESAPVPPEDCVCLYPTNREAEARNRKELAKLDGKEYVFRPKVVEKVKGRLTAEERKQHESEELHLKKGALVMITCNSSNGARNNWIQYDGYGDDISRLFVNGTVGRVVDIHQDGNDDNDSVTVAFTNSSGKCEEVTLKRRSTPIYEYVGKSMYKQTKAEVLRLSLVCAYGLTCHKAQGASYDRCCISPNFFCDHQGYVALSRCRSTAGIYLEAPLTPDVLTVDPDVENFYREIVGPSWDDFEYKSYYDTFYSTEPEYVGYSYKGIEDTKAIRKGEDEYYVFEEVDDTDLSHGCIFSVIDDYT